MVVLGCGFDSVLHLDLLDVQLCWETVCSVDGRCLFTYLFAREDWTGLIG